MADITIEVEVIDVALSLPAPTIVTNANLAISVISLALTSMEVIIRTRYKEITLKTLFKIDHPKITELKIA